MKTTFIITVSYSSGRGSSDVARTYGIQMERYCRDVFPGCTVGEISEGAGKRLKAWGMFGFMGGSVPDTVKVDPTSHKDYLRGPTPNTKRKLGKLGGVVRHQSKATRLEEMKATEDSSHRLQ